jgi:hypothetical protein
LPDPRLKPIHASMNYAIRFIQDMRWRANVLVSRKDGVGNMVGPLSDVRKARIMAAGFGL